MKQLYKFIFTTVIIMSVLLSCSSCTKKDQTNPTVITVAPPCSGSSCAVDAGISPPETSIDQKNKMLSGDGWEIIIPYGWQLQNSEEKEIMVLATNSDKQNLIIFIKEPFEGTYESYALAGIRGIKAAGGTLISAKQVILNGQEFVLIESIKKSIVVWAWITVHKGSGYVLTCGGDDKDLLFQKEACGTVSSSLNIK
jgi:hypothetical protein